MSSDDSYTCVVTYHTNPYTCGVARFNRSLANALAIPLVGVANYVTDTSGTALLSLKFEELDAHSAEEMLSAIITVNANFGLLLHAVTDSSIEKEYMSVARHIYAASERDAELIRNQRDDVVTLFAPGAPVIASRAKFDINLLSFGMAHKIRTENYHKLGELLRRDERTAQLEISSALHEGTSFNEDFFSVGGEIADVFEGNVNFLGFLADSEVSRRLTEVEALVAFFPAGARENNTTVLSAMAHGCAVITNLDDYSPPWMKHGVSVFNINELSSFPSNSELLEVGSGGKREVSPYTFERLAKLILNGVS